MAAVIALALVGTGVVGYLALYQYGVVRTVWEPFSVTAAGRC
ncbi:hypothetical protein [Saccharothrix deserti]|nr:hypothetical protein [Saccharothrix deserti]